MTNGPRPRVMPAADRHRRLTEALIDLAGFLAEHAPDGPDRLPVVSWRLDPHVASAHLATSGVRPEDHHPDPETVLQAFAAVLGEGVRSFRREWGVHYSVKGRIGPTVGGRPRTLVGLTADVRDADHIDGQAST